MESTFEENTTNNFIGANEEEMIKEDDFFDIPINDDKTDFAHSEVKPFEPDKSLGLSTLLREHQKTAVAWMIQREKTPVHMFCKGGLLMDEAGLGKTLETLTLIKANPTAPGFPTLVIAPASLIHVWAQEIKKHFKKNTFKVYHYYGQKRIGQNIDSILLNHDIILTSYGTLVQEYQKTKQSAMLGSGKSSIQDQINLYQFFGKKLKVAKNIEVCLIKLFQMSR
jgi:SNF2 family DNA or RNA helicase